MEVKHSFMTNQKRFPGPRQRSNDSSSEEDD